MGVSGRIASRVKEIGMPPVLFIVEVILTYALIRNMNLYFYLESTGIISTERGMICTAMIILDTITTILMVRAMIGLTSSDRYSWRKCVRTLIILIPMTAIYAVYELEYFIIHPFLIIAMMGLAITIMMLPSVRRYYTPQLRKVPPLGEWVRFIFIKPAETAYQYRFVYRDEE